MYSPAMPLDSNYILKLLSTNIARKKLLIFLINISGLKNLIFIFTSCFFNFNFDRIFVNARKSLISVVNFQISKLFKTLLFSLYLYPKLI
ncbi:CLUMA_CG008739, isoform A, partial [Clunio marinus]